MLGNTEEDESHEPCAELMASSASLLEKHPDPQASQREACKAAYLLAAIAVLRACKAAVVGASLTERDYLLWADRMITSGQGVADTSDRQEGDGARCPGDVEMTDQESLPKPGMNVKGLNTSLRSQEFCIAARLQDVGRVTHLIDSVLPDLQDLDAETLLEMSSWCKGEAWEETGVRKKCYRLALKLMLREESQSLGQLSQTLRELLKLTHDDSEKLKQFQEARSILTDLMTKLSCRQGAGEQQIYPDEELQWLIATCFNKGALHARFSREPETHRNRNIPGQVKANLMLVLLLHPLATFIVIVIAAKMLTAVSKREATVAAASKFWAAASSDEDEDSEEISGSGFNLSNSGSSDEDDARRVVKSAKVKRLAELKSCTEDMRNKMKINDWSSIQSLFDELNKRLEKCFKFQDTVGVPRSYVRMIAELDDFLIDTLGNKDVKKKMSPTNAKALSTMRQRLKKHNLSYAEQIAAFRENPDSTESEESEEEPEDEGENMDRADFDEDGFKTQQVAKKKDKMLTMDPKEITYEMVSKKLREIMLTRGRRGTDKEEQVLVQLCSSLFDLNPTMATHLKTSLWKKVIINMLEILKLLADNPNIKVDENYDMSEERLVEPEEGVEVMVWGNLVSFVERLDDEMFKSLQVIDPHTNEYLTRLRDEPVLLALAQKVLDYLVRVSDDKNLPRVALRLVEHLYYKASVVYDSMRKLTLAQQDGQAAAAEAAAEAEVVDVAPDADETVVVVVPSDYVMSENCHMVMKEMVSIIYRLGDERTKARGMLCTIYHKAIHDDFYGARDMLLMSHLQDSVQHMDISTQILYNRTMAQLGLAAFRKGLINEAHSCLNEIYGSGHIKELLAQGLSSSKYQEKTPEQELMEKRRQMPFHMHITLELTEAVYLICAMLMEVPAMAADPLNPKKKHASKSFHRILDTYNRQMFNGPPENVRDTVMAATKALMKGDWTKSFGYVSSLAVWNIVPKKETVLTMLKEKLQSEALRTYLFTYSPQYNSLSLDQLCQMFSLPEKRVYSLVSKMMIAEELHGSWDQPTRTIVMHSMDSSKLQRLALRFSDKAAVMTDLNERALADRAAPAAQSTSQSMSSLGNVRGGRRD
eukprot:gene14783-20833_t